MWRVFSAVVALLNLAVLVLAGVFLAKGYWQPTVGPSMIEYKDFVAILLTAVALMVAILAAAVTFAAVYGFDLIRREAIASAVEKATLDASAKAETVAARVADAFLSQKAPSHAYDTTRDYGVAAGDDNGAA